MPNRLPWSTDMEIRPIHTEEEYKAALREVSAYFDREPEPGTPEGDRFDGLMTLVEAYESKHFPLGGQHAEASDCWAAE